jgi:hypothetical protein
MTAAKTREQYVAAWTSHVNELIHPFIDSQTPINNWEETKANLMEVVEQAANMVYPDITCGACTVAIGAHTNDIHCKK